jgi:hypothetical protein
MNLLNVAASNVTIMLKCIEESKTLVEGVKKAEIIVERWSSLRFGNGKVVGQETVYIPFRENPQLANDVLTCVKQMLVSLATAGAQPLSQRKHL